MRVIPLLIAALAFASPNPAVAQTAPSQSEATAFGPLFRAAHSGTGNDVRAALSAGGNPHQRDGNNRTAAHVAAFASNDDALRALAEAGIDMNALDAQFYDVVTIAAVADDADLVALAIDLGNRPDLTTSIYDGTALIAAAHLGHHEVVNVLVRAGAPLDHVNNLNWTAVMEAVVLGDGGQDHVETLRILLDAGADRNIPDRDGVTALEHARSRGFSDMVELLS